MGLVSAFSGGRSCFAAALSDRLFLGLRQACATRGDAHDFGGIKQHTTSDADGFELSGSLQPKKRSLANFQNCESLSARKETRANRLFRDVCDWQVGFSLPKRAERRRDGRRLREVGSLVGEHCSVFATMFPNLSYFFLDPQQCFTLSASHCRSNMSNATLARTAIRL